VVKTRRAFTLVEMMVVIVIIAALSAILFPVLATARGAAQRGACISNLRQISHGTQLYLADYDDRLMPVSHHPGEDANSRNDRTWVQSLLPYVRNFGLFKCPSDYSGRPKPEATFDQDLVPGDTYSQFYTASLRSNYGYNYQNLSPVVQQGDIWVAQPKQLSEIASMSTTLVFVESAWDQTANGQPVGGGNWLVVPPCRYYPEAVDSFTGTRRAVVYTPTLGWLSTDGKRVSGMSETNSADGTLYGNAWPWHFGRMNVSYLDESVRSLTPKDLGTGCDVKDEWQGVISDAIAYPWDAR